MIELSGFWSGWVTVLSVLSFIGIMIAALATYFAKDKSADNVEHTVWDNDLHEAFNKPPMWWLIGTLTACSFSLGYLIMYPGLGNFAGTAGWSSFGALADESQALEDATSAERERLSSLSLDALSTDDSGMRAARRLYASHCAACHGPNARGQADMFPDLLDTDWTWGDEPAQIEASIRHGRQAVMVGWEDVYPTESIDALTDYVIALSQGEGDTRGVATGRALFGTCRSCHGPSGEGIALLGAPALNDRTWLYGGDRDSVRTSIAKGRLGVMPAQWQLSDLHVQLLVAYLRGGWELAPPSDALSDDQPGSYVTSQTHH